MWLNGVGQNRENDEEHYEDCVEEGFQLDRVKPDEDGEGGREALCTGNHSINICDVPIFSLYGISNTSIFKVQDVLH